MTNTQTVPVVSVFGIPVCKWGMQDTVNYLVQAVESGAPHQIITANPIMVMAAIENPSYKAMMQKADLIVPDGTGVVWASRKAGQPVQERVAGFDLMHELLKQGEVRGWKVFLLGSTSEVIQEASARLQLQYPRVNIVGQRDGFFGPNDDQEVIRQIQNVQPDLLFVARGADTQEPWIAKHKQQLNVPVIMGVGGSFDVISGRTKRAPKFMQKMHMEWFYRLLREPTRLRRMLALPKFTLKVMREGENLTKVR
ncbi:N-acetylglucosaminyldiphosphoundecaprenol N-acetyl-beta-D-mannosaminyltransferase [Paenibacillus shirakamiensis]|uniref:N-acetylglucosaminyldiphosphoundecaprenol N-acetyl-beta-D-mannosaminyltransferase n=1 Tax=Paenibacillus shirakamiensis TaxID=1265935 RepID=A0ABS4JJC8_9BACL|nr:WecB/TagA/CpsF family glycosyltransferase [Paenibacillus shirakamiensis]MBP2001797.1 N-acetylglucosaminyldiphosphoundecaprenol N-acetyl-beta-D-mannosaminyltransferase [Paenibacillus shirakamiensis]